MPKNNTEENGPDEDLENRDVSSGEEGQGEAREATQGPTPGNDAADSTAEEEASGIELIEPDPRIVELESAQAELQARLRAVSAAYKQQQDEMAATRARLQRQSALREEVRRGEVVAEIFEPVQNLQRSIDAAKKGSSMEDMVKGLEMLHHQFLEAFGKLGLEEVPGKGARFDPNLHEALTMVPVTEPSLDGIIIDVFSAGYRIGQRLITPARVIVGQAPEEPAVEAAEESESDNADAVLDAETAENGGEPTPPADGAE